MPTVIMDNFIKAVLQLTILKKVNYIHLTALTPKQSIINL